MKNQSDNPEMVKPSVDDNESFAHWQLPDVTHEATAVPDNIFGKRAHVDEPTEDAPETILPPTMAQIEDIRVQAETEGFEQGKLAGYAEGLEAGRLEGLEQGHLQGLEQGHQQGYEQGAAEAKEQAMKVAAILEQFQLPLSILDNQIEQELLSLVTSLSRVVVCHELHTHPEHILAALRQGVDSLPLKEQQVKLRLNPQDAQLIEELYSEEQLQRNRWQVELDPSLNAGDCIIDSQRSQVDMRLETRMKGVLEHMEQQSAQLQTQERQLQAEMAVRKPVVEERIPAEIPQGDPDTSLPPNEDIGAQNADSTTPSAE